MEPVQTVGDGLGAVAPGMLWIQETRSLVAADAHLAYEDVIGAALPTWSTLEAAGVIATTALKLAAREIVFLGDVIHGSYMSDGAADRVRSAMADLRAIAAVTLVAGNHEGRTRGAAVLGETIETAERAGWLLLHGDRAPELTSAANEGLRGCIIGHLHPSVRSSGTTAPAFLVSPALVVVPALTPYSSGLDVCGDDCFDALQRFGVRSRAEVQVFASTHERVYPLGALSGLRQELSRPATHSGRNGYHRKFLRSDR